MDNKLQEQIHSISKTLIWQDETPEAIKRSQANALYQEAQPLRQPDYRGLRLNVETMTDLLIDAMFPRHADEDKARDDCLAKAAALLKSCLAQTGGNETVVSSFLNALPAVHQALQKDLFSAYQGDPAAKSVDEVILCYPAFIAISTFRLAHVLYLEHVDLLPRMMTEYAHRQTGIDIHPGATIGDSFFIDHGTGVVIGETTTIGSHVKLYQHVTLGAKSFAVGEDGALVKGIKRHPDIGDRVVIYAGATILGGNTHIGDDCVIGGNVWLTHSVPAGKMVLARTAVTDTPLIRDIAPDPGKDTE